MRRYACVFLVLVLVVSLCPVAPRAAEAALQSASENYPAMVRSSSDSAGVVDVERVLSKTLGTTPRSATVIPPVRDFHEAFGVEFGYPAYNEDFDAKVKAAGGDVTAQKAAVLAEAEAVLDYDSLDAEGHLYKGGMRKVAGDATTVTELVRHTAGVSNYGESISDNVPATNKRLSVRMVRYGNVVTGLYAPPGEIVKVTLRSASGDTAARDLGLQAFIGNFGGNAESVSIPAKRNYVRMPVQEKALALNEEVNYIGSPFGGAILIYSKNRGGTTVEMDIEGAVEMPTYYYGTTSDEELERQLQAPGPYFAFSTPRGLRAVGPASLVRGKTARQIRRAMEFWDKAVGVSYQFESGSFDKTNPDTNLMVEMFEPYIPAGAAVNMGNYCICPVSWGGGFLDADGIMTSGAWGQIHEMNHSFPWGGATDNTTEITNNTISALTYQLYTNIAATRTEPANRSDPSSGGLSGWNWCTDMFTTVERLRLNELTKTGKYLYSRYDLGVYVPLQHAFGDERFIEAVHRFHALGGKYNKAYAGTDYFTNANLWMWAASEASGYDLGYYMRDVQEFPEYATVQADENNYITADVRSRLAAEGLPLYLPSGCLYASGFAYERRNDSGQAGAPAIVAGKGVAAAAAFAADKEIVEMGRPFRIPFGMSKTLDFSSSAEGGYVSVPKGAEVVGVSGYTKPEHGTLAEVPGNGFKLAYTPSTSHLEDSFYVTVKLRIAESSAQEYVGREQNATFKVSLMQDTSNAGFTTTVYSWENPSSVSRGQAVEYALSNGVLDQDPLSVQSGSIAGFDSVAAGTFSVTEGAVRIGKTGPVNLYVRGASWFSTCVAASADTLPPAADAQSKRDWPTYNNDTQYDTTAATTRIPVYVVASGETAPAGAESLYAAVIREGDPLYVRAYVVASGSTGRFRIGWYDNVTGSVAEFGSDAVSRLNGGDASGLETPSVASFDVAKKYSYSDPSVQDTALYDLQLADPFDAALAFELDGQGARSALSSRGNTPVSNMIDVGGESLATHFHGHTASAPYEAEFFFTLPQVATFNTLRYKGHAMQALRGKIRDYEVYVATIADPSDIGSIPDVNDLPASSKYKELFEATPESALCVAVGTANQANDYDSFNMIDFDAARTGNVNGAATGNVIRLVARSAYPSNGEYYYALSDVRAGALESISGKGTIVDSFDRTGSWDADDAFVNTRSALMSTTDQGGSFTFSGTGVIMYAVTGPQYGSMLVSLDGGPESVVSEQGDKLLGQQPVFWKSGLAEGSHTVAFRPRVAGSDRINVEYFEVKNGSAEQSGSEPAPAGELPRLDVQLEYERCAYTGSLIEPAATVMLGDVDVTSECAISYENNLNAGIATVTASLLYDVGETISGSATFEILKEVYANEVSVSFSGGGASYHAGGAIPLPVVSGAPEDAEVEYRYSDTLPEHAADLPDDEGLDTDNAAAVKEEGAVFDPDTTGAALEPGDYYLWAIVSSPNFNDIVTDPIAFTVLPKSDASAAGGEQGSQKPDDGAKAAESAATKTVYWVAKKKNGQRFYLTSLTKARKLASSGWKYRGTAFTTVSSGGVFVYRLKAKNRSAGKVRYHYTTNNANMKRLMKKGWRYQGVAFRALQSGGTPVYRMKKRATGEYRLEYRSSTVKALKKKGWRKQGVAFYIP